MDADWSHIALAALAGRNNAAGVRFRGSSQAYFTKLLPDREGSLVFRKGLSGPGVLKGETGRGRSQAGGSAPPVTSNRHDDQCSRRQRRRFNLFILQET